MKAYLNYRDPFQWFAGGFELEKNKRHVPGRRLVTAQRFTTALYAENENWLRKLNIPSRWHTQTWTHLHGHSHNNGRRAKRRHAITGSLTVGVVHLDLSTLWLPPFLSLSLFFFFFLCFLLISLWIKHFTTALPFLSKHHFSFVIYRIFVTKHVQAV